MLTCQKAIVTVKSKTQKLQTSLARNELSSIRLCQLLVILQYFLHE